MDVAASLEGKWRRRRRRGLREGPMEREAPGRRSRRVNGRTEESGRTEQQEDDHEE